MKLPLTFPRTHRLCTRTEFSRVFDERTRESRGPLTVYVGPNDLPHPRLGLSIGRATRPAARRNRIKRLIRESFRLHQHELPGGYDFVVVIRPHEPYARDEYERIVPDLMIRASKKRTHKKCPEQG